MVGDFGWEHEGTKSGVGTVKQYLMVLLDEVFCKYPLYLYLYSFRCFYDKIKEKNEPKKCWTFCPLVGI